MDTEKIDAQIFKKVFTLIRNHCIEYKDCSTCPFHIYDSLDLCVLGGRTPSSWNMKEVMVATEAWLKSKGLGE